MKNPKDSMEKEVSFSEAIEKSVKAFSKTIPIILGTILLVSLASLIPNSFYLKIFQGTFLDPLIGAIIGSISAGNPITSYIFGGELLKQGVSLIAVTAFLVSWVSVGTIQLPAEASLLGKKFAIYRNLLSFIFSIIIATLTVLIYNLI